MFEESADKSLESTKKRALKILGSRQMSCADMERRLVQKGESEQNARSAVEWLERIGAVDDVQFAEAICTHYCAKGYGLARIKDELFKRQIPRELWQDALSAVNDDEMHDAAVEFLKKRLRGSGDKDDMRRAVDALCRRGFSYEDAKAAIARYLESVGNTEESEMMD